MKLRKYAELMDSPLLLRFLGTAMVVMGLFMIGSGALAGFRGEELWWGDVGAGVLSLAFSVLPFIFSIASAEMKLDKDQERVAQQVVNRNAGQRTLH